jgi:hypothetical protein
MMLRRGSVEGQASHSDERYLLDKMCLKHKNLKKKSLCVCLYVDKGQKNIGFH